MAYNHRTIDKLLIAWPMVIIVGTHADKIEIKLFVETNFKNSRIKFFLQFPYADHIYGSGNLFNSNDEYDSPETQLQSQQHCGQLHNILKDFVDH